MRILLLTDKPPWPADSGGAFASGGLITGLAQTGNNITIVTLYSRKHPFEALNEAMFQGVETIIPVYADTSVSPVKLLTNLLLSDKPYSLERFLTDDFEKSISPLRETEFDLAIFEGLKTTLYFESIRRLKVRRIIYRPHNVESQIWKQLSDNENNLFKKAYFRSLSERIHKAEAAVLNRADGIAAMTENDLNRFISYGAVKPSTVINPGIPVELLPDRKGELPLSVAWIGSLDWKPNINGIEWFIKNVWPLVTAKNPAARFYLAGRNPRNSLGKWLTSNNIHYYGQVHSSTGFLSDKSVVVSPLFAGSGIRIKILEAMSLGKPVVATQKAAEGIRCNDGEDLLIADDPRQFAERISGLLGDRLLRNTMGDKARENVIKNYNIFEAAEKLINFHSGLPDAD